MIVDRALADAIRGAWAHVPPPLAVDFEAKDDPDHAIATRVRGDWLGRDWRAIDGAFLSPRTDWPYFRGPALHYFLPAFLLAALEPDAHRAHIDVIMILGPAAHRVAAGLRDDRLDARLAPLDPHQREVAAKVLAHLVDRSDATPYVRWCAATAIETAWGGGEAARAFLAELRWWSRPPAPDDLRETLIELIETSFADTPAPSDDDLRGSDQGDEPYEVELGFRGVAWKHASPMLLNVHDAALAFLSHAAHRYFLPAFLIADVLELLRAADPVFYLTHGLGRADADDRFAIFSPEERTAIIAYLRWRQDDPYDRERIQDALDGFWDVTS
ncbi:MAG TPA: DUF6714 family protein [Kofleriaceae bacterium]|nr:DUF6714 family protein [Kofleriaceae bacterium]